MGSSNNLNLMLLVLLAIALILVAKAIPSEEENEELERQLKTINKPPIKSFKSKHGYILDCIDIQKQLAFDHPMLKNHSIQLKPTTIPKWTSDNNTSSSQPFRQDEDNIICPPGTVIVKRTTLEDLKQMQHLKSLGLKNATSKESKILDLTGRYFALAQYFEDNYGAAGNLNIWDPQVSHPDQYSLASVSVQKGFRDMLQSISAGWIVSPRLNKKHSSLFIYWTTDGYNKISCYNTLCPGFVQVSRKLAPGTLAKPVSIYNGQQYILQAGFFQDPKTGSWWVVLGTEAIGYWPRSLFSADGLAYGASRVYWGGEVYTAVRQEISPKMGSGHFPQEGYKKAAYVNGLNVLDVSGHVTSPPMSALGIFANSPSCYNAQTKSGVGAYWSRAMFYGGPGGCTPL